MSTPLEIAAAHDRELVLARLLDAPADKLFRCWTEPELIKRWFTPPPWETIEAQVDLRPGGACLIVMRGPDGTEVPNPGVYLEVVPGRKLVTTDAYVDAWTPSARPFITIVLTFEAVEGGRTRYIVRVQHWTVEGKAEHEAMGFHQGWGMTTDQLEALARSL